MGGDDAQVDWPDGEEWTLEDPAVAPPMDGLFRALAGPRRIAVLSTLLEGSPRPVDELTDVIVGSDATVDGPAGPDEWAQVKIELVHAHLPLLADVGLVEYDTVEETVTLMPLADPVEEVIHFAEAYRTFLARNGQPTRSE